MDLCCLILRVLKAGLNSPTQANPTRGQSYKTILMCIVESIFDVICTKICFIILTPDIIFNLALVVFTDFK